MDNFKKATLYDESVTTTVSDSTEMIRKQDPIVLAVIEKYKQRSQLGIKKYGTTLAENNHDDFMLHFQQEMMDGALYAEKVMAQAEERKAEKDPAINVIHLGQFAVNTLKDYAHQNGVPPRSTSDISGLEQWLIRKLFELTILT